MQILSKKWARGTENDGFLGVHADWTFFFARTQLRAQIFSSILFFIFLEIFQNEDNFLLKKLDLFRNLKICIFENSYFGFGKNW